MWAFFAPSFGWILAKHKKVFFQKRGWARKTPQTIFFLKVLRGKFLYFLGCLSGALGRKVFFPARFWKGNFGFQTGGGVGGGNGILKGQFWFPPKRKLPPQKKLFPFFFFFAQNFFHFFSKKRFWGFLLASLKRFFKKGFFFFGLF